MDKKAFTEADIRTKFITPALVSPAGSWKYNDPASGKIFTKGHVIVRGKTVKRGEAKKADYLLFYKPGIPIAVIEAKDNEYTVTPASTGARIRRDPRRPVCLQLQR